MTYRYLGRRGMKVSELCLGAMTFGRELDPSDSHRVLDRFVDSGGTFIDTANVYNNGESEKIIGDWLKGRDRHQVVLATKVRFPMGEGPNDTGSSRKNILRQIDESLRRLGTDFVDLYQLHCWDEGTDLDETLLTMDQLVRDGKVRYIGASNYTGRQLQRAVDLQCSAGLERFRCLQPQYSLLCRSTEWDLVPLCREEGIGIIPWSPLKGGWLTGKYRKEMDAPPAQSRVGRSRGDDAEGDWRADVSEQTWAVVEELVSVADTLGRHPAQVALRWLLQKPGVTAPIVGVSRMDHLSTALGAAEFELEAETLARLDAVSETKPPYPWNFVFRANDDR